MINSTLSIDFKKKAAERANIFWLLPNSKEELQELISEKKLFQLSEYYM